MRLSWRDALATLIVLVGLAFALAVTQGWSWPLMNGVRAGIIALGLAGILACSASGWAQDAQEEGPSFYRTPFFIGGALLGTFLLIVGIVGLFANTMVFLAWMMAAFALLWLLTLVHRLMPLGTASKHPTPA